MKKVLCVLFLFLFLSSPASAEHIASNDEIIAMLEYSLESAGFEYASARFNDELSLFVIDIADDGFAKQIASVKANGKYSNNESWTRVKEDFATLYNSTIVLFKKYGRNDVDAWLNLVNDDLYIHSDYNSSLDSTLLSICRGKVITDVMEQFSIDDKEMRDLILYFFESRGYSIKYAMFQPLVEKDNGGLYGGKERWFITFENGEQIAAWVADGKIDYFMGTEWFFDVPLL